MENTAGLAQALRNLIALAPAEVLNKPEYKQALTALSAQDGAIALSPADDEKSDQELVQHLTLLAMEITRRCIAHVNVCYSGHVDAVDVIVRSIDQIYGDSIPQLRWMDFICWFQHTSDRKPVLAAIAKLERLLTDATPILFDDLKPAHIENLASRIRIAGFNVSGPTDHRAAEHGEPVWVCNARAEIAALGGATA